MNEKKEITEFSQAFLPEVHPGAIPLHQKLSYVAGEPSSRYKLPVSRVKKFLFKVIDKTAVFMGLQRALLPFSARAPVNSYWQLIVDYLYEKKVITSPRVFFDTMPNDEPRLFGLRFQAAHNARLTDAQQSRTKGWYSRGVSKNFDEAMSKVIGELLERQPLTLYKKKELIRASISDLEKRGVRFFDPRKAAQASDEQKKKFPYRSFSERDIFSWVKEGVSLLTGEAAYLPAQLVYWIYHAESEEPQIQQSITNGAGGHFTKEEAVLSGLYELIQRDAFLIHWFNGFSPKKIRNGSLADTRLRELIEECGRYLLGVHILDVTSDIAVPSYIVVLTDDTGGGPAVSMGGGCDLDREDAIYRALIEALSVRYWLINNADKDYGPLPEQYEPFGLLIGQTERLVLWGRADMRKKFDFFLKGEEKDIERDEAERHKSKKDELDALVKMLAQKGKDYETFAFFPRNEVLETLGYWSARVLVPALIPLYLNERSASVNARRVTEAPKAMGLEPSREINTLPHPFP